MTSDKDLESVQPAGADAVAEDEAPEEDAVLEDELKENPLDEYEISDLEKLMEVLYKKVFKKPKASSKIKKPDAPGKVEKPEASGKANKPKSRHWWQKAKSEDAGAEATAEEPYTDYKSEGSFTVRELQIGARLAKNYGLHEPPKSQDIESGKNQSRRRPSLSLSMISESALLEPHEWAAYKVQKSKAFWDEPKDLLITILACCMASMTQGWDQVANGNLGWPKALGVSVTPQQTGADVWTFGAVNAITWFSAAILGPLLVDPVCYWKWFGRRGSVFIAASFSFAASIGASRATSWQGFFIARLFLGIGIGAKASIVPIWESEVLPPAKRGRILVSWQFFTALGIFAGSCATYIFRDNWRNQVLSGALPALILLVLTYLTCESPRWLITQGQYVKAFDTLVRLRKERVLAAEEFCYIYFQIQTERALSRGKKKPKFSKYEKPIGYLKRVSKLVIINRNRRAAIATMIVMISQQLSGINILAFLASIFFFSADLSNKSSDHDKTMDGLKFSIGFGAANFLFSALAYPLIEPLPVDPDVNPMQDNENPPDPVEVQEKQETHKKKKRRVMYGRRALLLSSLGGGTVMLFILTFLLRLDKNNGAKLPLVMIFIILFTLFYSPGAGAVPFLYSAEVWPNEGREAGMSWGVLCNFLGSGFLALFVPRGFTWGSSKLFGLFTAFSFIGMLLVYFFVPSTDHATTLEEMSGKFRTPLHKFGLNKLRKLKPFEIQWKLKSGKNEKASNSTEANTPTNSQPPPSGETAKQPVAEAQPVPEIQPVTETKTTTEHKQDPATQTEAQPKA